MGKLQYHNVKVMLADGTKSGKQTRSMQYTVVAANGKKVRLQFFVMAGPNNLLGRLALKTIWPEQYGAPKEAAEVPVNKTEVKSQAWSVGTGAGVAQRQRNPEPAVPRVAPDMTAAGQQPQPLPRRQAPPLPVGDMTE